MTVNTDMSAQSIFVGGPIQHAIRNGGFDEATGDAIKEMIRIFTMEGATVFSAHVVERFGVETPLFSPETVTARDFNWMRECDVFVPVLPLDRDGCLMRSDGTHIEIGWASAMGKPIMVVTQSPVPADASHLLKGLPTVADVCFVDIRDFMNEKRSAMKTVRELVASARGG